MGSLSCRSILGWIFRNFTHLRQPCVLFSFLLIITVIYGINVLIYTRSTVTVTGLCGLPFQCADGYYSYLVRSGLGTDVGPYVCFNGVEIISQRQNNFKRGVNLVIINNDTLDVVDIQYFDTFVTGDQLFKYLKLSVAYGHIAVLASFDEMATNLNQLDRAWLEHFGSSSSSKIAYRDSFVMIGQKGLASNGAIEMLAVKGKREKFPTVFAEVKGCLMVPLGTLSPIVVEGWDVTTAVDGTMQSEPSERCDLALPCPPTLHPVSILSGRDIYNSTERDFHICFDGHIYLRPGLNYGGRGFNFLVFDNKMKPKCTGHFDTYQYDSMNLEGFLRLVDPTDIIIGLVTDEASKSLSWSAIGILQSMGSAQVQNLKFRDIWYFVGKGHAMALFSEFEKINYNLNSQSWPQLLTAELCLDSSIPFNTVPSNELAPVNYARRHFCERFQADTAAGQFCDAQHRDLPFDVLGNSNTYGDSSNADSPNDGSTIYQYALVVIARTASSLWGGGDEEKLEANASKELTRLQLEVLAMQPGLRRTLVFVACLPSDVWCSTLATAFGMRSLIVRADLLAQLNDQLPAPARLDPLLVTSSYSEFARAVSLYAATGLLASAYKLPGAYVTLVRHGCMMSVDFLALAEQLLPVVHADPMLLGIGYHAFNSFQTAGDGAAATSSPPAGAESAPHYGPLVYRAAPSQLALAYTLKTVPFATPVVQQLFTGASANRSASGPLLDSCCPAADALWLADPAAAAAARAFSVLVPALSRAFCRLAPNDVTAFASPGHAKAFSSVWADLIFTGTDGLQRRSVSLRLPSAGSVVPGLATLRSAAAYKQELMRIVNQSDHIGPNLIRACQSSRKPLALTGKFDNNTIVLVYRQLNSQDYRQLESLRHCFPTAITLFRPSTLYFGSLRFIDRSGYDVLLIGERSELFETT